MADPIEPLAPARVVLPARARCRITHGAPRVGFAPMVPVVYPQGHDDRLLIVGDLGQTRLAEIRDVAIDKPSWVLNGVGSMGFTCSAWNDAMEYLVDETTVLDRSGVMKLVGREVQFWRDGVLQWAGPPVTGKPRVEGTVAFQCMDLGWHLARKFFGAAERRDLLLGVGSMDDVGLPGWSVTGSAVKARDNVDRVRGTASMSLTGSGAVQAAFTQPARNPAPPIHLTAMVKIPSGTPEGTRIMTITVRDGATVRDEASVLVDSSTPFGQWHRVSTYANQPNSASHTMTVTLWSPGTYGATKFDDVRSLENNTTGIPSPGADLTTHALAGLNHIQTGLGQGDGFGFGFEVLSAAGVVETLGERHLNHAQFTDFLSRYSSRTDGFDWRIDPATRTLQVGQRVGVDHVNIALHDRAVRSGGFTSDESQIAAKVVVPGEGNGVDRPEGGYSDTSRTRGLMYDDFHQPPADTALSALDPIAFQRWDQVSQPQITFDDLAISDDHLGTVNPGDTITGTMTIGWFRLPMDTPVRVGQVELDIEAGQLALT